MNSKVLLAIIIAVSCLGQFATDAYAPSIPAIAIDLNTQLNLAKFSLVAYMFGVAASMLIYGVVSEGVGRKKPLIVGLIIMLCGGIICIWAPNIDILIFGRLIRGMGAGACAGLWRAIFRDVYSGEQLAKIGAYLAIFITFIIPAAPTIGGYIQQYIGWRATFVFISCYTLFTLLTVIFKFKDTSKNHHKERLQLSFIRSTFHKLLIDRTFLGVALCSFLTYGAFFSWFAVAPVLLIHRVGISPVTFGWICFIGCGAAYSFSGWLNGKLVKRLGMPNMMRIGWSIMIFAGLLMLAGKFIIGVTLWSIFIPVFLLYFGSTFVWPSAFATAITPFGEIAGYAGALYSFMQISGAAIIGSIAAHLPDENQVPLAIIFITVPIAALLVHECIIGMTKGDR